jgi:transposase
MAMITIGIDLTKNVFTVHGVNEAGKPALVRPPCDVLQGRIAVFKQCSIAAATPLVSPATTLQQRA